MNKYIQSLKDQNKLNLSTDKSISFKWPYTKIAGPCSVEGDSIIQISKESLKNNELRFIAVSEAFGAPREIKVGNLEKIYIKSFSNPAKIFAKARTSAIVISQLPRFILEAFAFGGILMIILFIMTQTGSFNSALPIISLYVVAGYRLMPALQNIYSSFNLI